MELRITINPQKEEDKEFLQKVERLKKLLKEKTNSKTIKRIVKEFKIE